MRKAGRSTQPGGLVEPTAGQSYGFRRWMLWGAVFLTVINLLAYAPVRDNDFLNYDTNEYVTENPHVLGGLNWKSLNWAFSSSYAANWHPITWLSHILDVEMFGLDARAHHLTNVAFHIANTVLLFSSLFLMTAAPYRSLFVASVFAVHPLHVESVAWVAERKDVLSSFFAMSALCAYVFYVRRPRMTRYLIVMVLFALGLMSKPKLVTLPFVFLLLDFWPLRRFTPEKQMNALRLVWEKAPLFVLAGISSVVTIVVQHKGGAMAALDVIPIGSRIANAPVAYFTYIKKMFWPADLAILYPLNSQMSDWWVLAAIGLLALSIAAFWLAPKLPYAPVGWFWFLGGLFPVIGIIQVGRQAMADRYMYQPMIGLLLIIAFGAMDSLNSPRTRKVLAGAAAVSIAVCIWQTNRQLDHWDNSVALWEHTIKVTETNALAHFNLGAALETRGDVNEAIQHYSEALRIEPDYADAHFSFANASLKSGAANSDQILIHLNEALRIKPDFAEAWNALGIYSTLQGRLGESITQFSEAVRLKPEYAVAHNNLGTALARTGAIDRAISQYLEAVRLDNANADAHTNLGALFAATGKTDEAIRHLTQSLRINPNNSAAANALADLKTKNSRSQPNGLK